MARTRSSIDAKPPKLGELYTGTFQSGGRSGSFVVLETPGMMDIFVPSESGGLALHGDQVRVKALRYRSGLSPEGEVERVLRHANKFIIGQIQRSGKKSVVIPKSSKIRRLIEIPRTFKQEEVPQNAWVSVEIKTWSDSPDEPLIGKLKEVIGVEGDKKLPILLLIREGGVALEFTPEVEAEVEEIRKRAIGETEIARRRDFRPDRVITIDPITAKDFDDAINLVEKLKDGWRIGVHIADVAHYVTPGTKVDAEAYDRATSVYPVDRVIPMLPEALSNDLCSLRPGEDKMTMSAVFDVNRHGEVRNVELYESIIHSVRRFSYEEVQGILDREDGLPKSKHPQPEIPQAVLDDLLEMRAAAAALLKERMRRGSLDLDLPETEIVIDEEGIVTDVRRKERFEAHRLIEDLMIAANEAVARELTRRNIPVLYRVHEEPNEEKLAHLAPAFSRFGIFFPTKGGVDQETLQKALMKAVQHPAGAIVQRLVLRSMRRAVYQPENLGHYGLASDCYTHFTSPIRRYPDLVTHRAVKAMLKAPDAQNNYAAETARLLPEWGRHTSQREERSQRMEWDAEKILTLEFMKKHMGDVFEGFIGGMMNKGFFVELVEYPAEGFVPIRTLTDDFYDLDDTGMAFHGRRTSKVYALGDRVTVQIERIDVMAGEMDFHLVRKDPKAERKERRAEKEKRKSEKKGRATKSRGKK